MQQKRRGSKIPRIKPVLLPPLPPDSVTVAVSPRFRSLGDLVGRSVDVTGLRDGLGVVELLGANDGERVPPSSVGDGVGVKVGADVSDCGIGKIVAQS